MVLQKMMLLKMTSWLSNLFLMYFLRQSALVMKKFKMNAKDCDCWILEVLRTGSCSWVLRFSLAPVQYVYGMISKSRMWGKGDYFLFTLFNPTFHRKCGFLHCSSIAHRPTDDDDDEANERWEVGALALLCLLALARSRVLAGNYKLVVWPTNRL